MRPNRSEIPVGRTTLLVWSGLVAVGGAATLASGQAAAGALVILALLLAIASPIGALYATCAAIPLVFRPIDVGSLELGLLELGTLITVAGTLIRYVFDLVEGRQRPVLRDSGASGIWVLPALLLLVGTFSLVWMPFNAHVAEALRTWRWVVVEPLLLFALARMAIARDGHVPLTLAIVLPAGIVALAAVWQFGSASSEFSVDEVHRSTATYLHPNNLALYLERAAMLAVVPALFLRSRSRVSLFVLAAVLFAGLAATFSRGAILGVASGFVLVLLAHPIRNGWKFLGAGALTVVAAFALTAGTRFSGADSSGFLDTRQYLWAGATRMVRDFPLSGIGLDQFLWLNQSRYVDPAIWSERYTSHPHNLLLDSWLSLGLPGLMLLLAFSIVLGWVVWRARHGRVTLNPWQLGALGCLGAGLGHGLVDNGYFLADLSAFTWLAIALLAGAPSGITLKNGD